MRHVLLGILSASLIFGQTPISVPDNAGGRALPGDATNRAIRVVCVNPSNQTLQSCAGSGGGAGSDVNIASIGGNTVTTTLPVSVPGSVAVTGTFWQATQPISASSLPLPTGAATSGNQTTANTSLSSIDGKLPSLVTGRVPVDGSGVTQPVSGTVGISGSVAVTGTFWQATQPISAASLPLPTGASTSANQTTANTSLANIETYTSRIPALGQALAAASVPVVLTAAQLSTLTPLSTVAVTQSTSPWVVSNGGTFAVQAAQSGTWNIGSITTLPSIPAGTNNIGDVDVLTVPADPFGANADAASATGSISAKLRFIAATGIPTQATLQTGSNIVGRVGLDQTTPGTTNAFSLAYIGSTAVATGNGVVGAGVPRVAIASDNTAFSVNATLSAETTKVIGTVNISAAQSIATTNAGTFAVQPASATAPVSTMNSASANAGINAAAAFVFDDVSPTSITENSFGFGRMSANRNQYVTLRDAAGNERGLNIDANGELGISAIRSALPAGTNAIGKLAANSGVTIGAIEIAASQSVAVTQATSSNLKGQMDPLTAASWGLGATGAAPPSSGNFQTGIGSGATGGLAIGPTICDQWVAINGTASAQLIAGVSGRKIYFCSGNIQMNGGANTISFVSGTGSTCGTGTTAVPGFDGATTAANGYSFAANSGMTWDGANGAAFARTTNNADNFCILVGSATRVVGGLNYAIY